MLQIFRYEEVARGVQVNKWGSLETMYSSSYSVKMLQANSACSAKHMPRQQQTQNKRNTTLDPSIAIEPLAEHTLAPGTVRASLPGHKRCNWLQALKFNHLAI